MKGLRGTYDLTIPLMGEFQMENAATAVAAVESLNERGAKVTTESIATGLREVRWPGRVQVLKRRPWVIADSAHNAYSFKKLVQTIKGYFRFKRAILILGMSSDKDVAGIVAEAAALTGEVIVTRSRNPRALDTAVMIREFSGHGITPQVAGDAPSALRLAMAKAAPGDLICAAGSVFLAAEVMEEMGVKEF